MHFRGTRLVSHEYCQPQSPFLWTTDRIQVYGPHVAMLYANSSSQPSLQSLGHYFKTPTNLEGLLGLAGASYELVASLPAVGEYLSRFSWESIVSHEERLQGIIIDYLNSRDDISIWGEPVADATKRVPVISFTVSGRSSQSIVEAVEAKTNFGFRWGAFYSNRLVEEVLGLDPVDGVVRVSLVHYNTGKYNLSWNLGFWLRTDTETIEEEVRAFVAALDDVLRSD